MISVTITRKELKDQGAHERIFKFFDSISVDDTVFIQEWGILHSLFLARANVLNFLLMANVVPMIGFEFSDLAGLDLSDTFLDGKNFLGSDFTKTNLSNVCFACSDLKEVNFDGAILANVDFGYSDLRSTNFEGANFNGKCDFAGARRDKTDPAIPGWKVVDGCLQKE